MGLSKSAKNGLLACESKVLKSNDTVWRGAEKYLRDIYNEYEALGKSMSGLTIFKCVKDIIKTLIIIKKEGLEL